MASDCTCDEMTEYLGFRVADRSYALDMRYALAIRPYAKARCHVGPSLEVHSLFDDQHQCYVPVLDLRALQSLDKTPAAPSPLSVLILTELAQRRLALLADAIIDVLALVPSEWPRLKVRQVRSSRGPRTVQLLEPRQLIALLPAGGQSHQ